MPAIPISDLKLFSSSFAFLLSLTDPIICQHQQEDKQEAPMP